MFQFSFYNQICPITFPQLQSFNIYQDFFQLEDNYPPRQRIRKHKPANNKPNTNNKSNGAQRIALKEGLQKSLGSNNKGFEMIKRMGYEEGKPLGKNGRGIIEPIPLAIKDNPLDRAGLGKETKVVANQKQEIKPTIGIAKAVVKKESVANSTPTTKREKKIIKVQTDFSEDIELLRLRLKAELSIKSEETMIVAKVTIIDNRICDEIFEIIHQYLVNSLHVYKATPYPMFHDIAHVDNRIKVICEDKPSFDYLASCIAALSESLSMPMTTKIVSPIDSNVYLFSVQMEGLVSGQQSFLTQIKKHRFEFKPDRWIITSQSPCQATNKTHLQIITDEYSAMLLIYRHCLKLFVCMQEMHFKLQGVIPFKG